MPESPVAAPIHRTIGALLLLAAPLAAQAPAGPVTYHLLPDSRLEVKTGKAGLFGFAGHEHVIRARAFEGEVVYDPADLAAGQVHIAILTDSLEVLTPPDTAEIRKVTAAMRSEVLMTDSFPLIELRSRALNRVQDGYRLQFDLTLHGRTRPVEVPLTLAFEGDTLVAATTFSLKQSDFGIRPFSGGPAGTVKVADKVEFRIAARALPVSPP